MTKKISVIVLLFLSVWANAQTAAGPEMADAMREDGKIYVVIGVLALIFAAIVLFLVYLERKVKKLEDKVNNK